MYPEYLGQKMVVYCHLAGHTAIREALFNKGELMWWCRHSSKAIAKATNQGTIKKPKALTIKTSCQRGERLKKDIKVGKKYKSSK